MAPTSDISIRTIIMKDNDRQKGISDEKCAELKAKRDTSSVNTTPAAVAPTVLAASAPLVSTQAVVAPSKPKKRYRIKKSKPVRKYIQEWRTFWTKEAWDGEYEHRKMLQRCDAEEDCRPYEITGDDEWVESGGYSDDERLVEDEALTVIGSYEVDEEIEDEEGDVEMEGMEFETK